MNEPMSDTNTSQTSKQINASEGHDGVMAKGFLWIERMVLVVIAVLTLGAAGLEIGTVIQNQTVTLADILLMFLYLEVLGMISVFYSGKGSPFVYPIYIAITALARLIVLQGKDMAPEKILFEAGAILLLGIAVVVVTWARQD